MKDLRFITCITTPYKFTNCLSIACKSTGLRICHVHTIETHTTKARLRFQQFSGRDSMRTRATTTDCPYEGALSRVTSFFIEIRCLSL